MDSNTLPRLAEDEVQGRYEQDDEDKQGPLCPFSVSQGTAFGVVHRVRQFSISRPPLVLSGLRGVSPRRAGAQGYSLRSPRETGDAGGL